MIEMKWEGDGLHVLLEMIREGLVCMEEAAEALCDLEILIRPNPSVTVPESRIDEQWVDFLKRLGQSPTVPGCGSYS